MKLSVPLPIFSHLLENDEEKKREKKSICLGQGINFVGKCVCASICLSMLLLLHTHSHACTQTVQQFTFFFFLYFIH